MTSWRSRIANRPSHVAAAFCAIAGVLLFQFFGNSVRGYIDTGSVFWWWGFQWFNPGSETEHGPLIVALAGWIFWRNLRRDPLGGDAGGAGGLGNAGRVGSASKLAAYKAGDRGVGGWAVGGAGMAMAVGLALHALAYTVQQTRLSILALLVFTWGVLRLAGGRRWGRAAAFPLLLLLFAVPVEFLDAVGFHLRLGVIATTEWLARAAGIEVIRNGTQLFAPDGGYQYDVAAACSGVRSLMALLALSLLIGYLRLQTWRARLAVFILAFPLTFLGNVVRIAAIVFAGEVFGQRAGVWVHEWAGFVVFAIVLGGVHLAAGGLARREPAGPVMADQPGDRARPAPAPGWRAGAATAGLVIALAGVTAWFTQRVDEWGVAAEAGVALGGDGGPAPLPPFLGSAWIGQESEVSAIERELLPADTGFARRTYVSLEDRRRQVFLSIVLSGRDRTSIHRPELCLVGQGWTIEQRSHAVFEHPSGGLVPAAVLHLSREVVDARGVRRAVPSIFVYWFVGRDTVATTTAGRMWRTALNRLMLKPDRWAYVVAQTLLLPPEDANAALQRVQEVLRGTLPEFQPAVATGQKKD